MIKKSRVFLFKNITAIIYSFALTGGMYSALVELHNNRNYSTFILFSILIFAIYIIELFVNWINKSSRLEINLNINDEVNELNHLIHKVFLPIAFYISLVGFGYFNITSHSLLIMLVIIFITFFILFINIRAFFQSKLQLEYKTHYIYDIIKFLIYFNTINVLSNLTNNYPNSILVCSALSFLTSIILLTLMLWRYKYLHFKSLTLAILLSLFIFLSFFLTHSYKLTNSLQISLVLLFIFYLASALIHHTIMKTLTRNVLIEYIIVIILVFTITYGIS